MLNLLQKLAIIALVIVPTGLVYSQVNCTGATPFFTVDLTGNPSGTWVSPAVVRDGTCCGGGANQVNCIELSITLDPGAEGIIFNVASGANPGGALYFQINCQDVPVPSGSAPICLNGVGPHLISYCKVGNNTNTYSITSVPAPASSGDVVTADGCQDTLSVFGLTPSTITWTSIPQNGQPQGYYNNYLNNLAGSQPGTSGVTYTGQSTVIVTPQPGYPPSISYQVCGQVIGGCSSSSFCDTVTVSIYPTLFAQINPTNPSICFGSPGTTLTAVPIGGTAPYTYLWTGPSSNGATTSSILASVPGVYTLSITDATGCPAATTNVTVTQFVNTITANAGPDITVCGSPVPTINVAGSVTGVTTGIWSGGAGTYSPSNTSLNLNYTPTAAEIASGSVNLTLTTTNNGTCPGANDQVTISLTQFTSTLTTSPTNVSCFGGANGAVDLTVNGGFSPATYSWSNGATTQDISGLTAGSYTVTVTDVNGCIGSTTQAITQPALLVANLASLTNASCFGGSNGSATVSVSGGTSGYQFSLNGGPNQGSGTFSGLAAGSYSVLVTDANGCTATQDFTITQPLAPLSLTFTQNNVLCFGGTSGSIDLTPSGGTTPYTYSWSNGATTQDISGLSAGSYTVIVNDANGSTGGCTATVSVTITEPAAPVTLSFSQSNVLCSGGSNGSIDLSVNGGTPGYTYLWSNGATTQDLTGVPAGTYTVTVNDANGSSGGCTANTSVTITQPTPLTQSVSAFVYPSGTNISCNGLSDGSINLTIGGGTPGYTYLWSNGSTLEDPSGLTAGTYTVVATDANGCTINSLITLTQPAVLNSSVNPSLYPGGVNVSGCVNDGSIDLTPTGGNPGYTYLWSNGATTQDISGLAAGTYSVTITDVNGCQTTNGFTLVGPNPMISSVSATTYPSGTNISCFGASDGFVDLVVNGGTPNYSYAWSNGATTQDLSNVPAGTYTVTITDANGCQTNESITLTQPVVLTSSLSPSVYAGGFNVSGCVPDGEIDLTVVGGNPGYTYLWSNGSTIEDLTNLAAGTYTVTVTDINGCQTLSNITLTQPGDLTETISATTFPSGTNISCFGASDGNIDLTPNGGTPGYTYLWSNGATTQDLNNVPAGTYGVTITDQNGCQVSSSITLTQPPVLNQNISAFTYASGSNISCFGLSNGSIDLTVFGGNPSYGYLWNTGATTQDISGLPAGTYSVTVTDLNGCTVNANITLVEPTQLIGGLVPSIYAGGVNVSGCVNDGTIDLTVNGGSPIYTYLWSNGSTSQDLSGLAAGNYSVTVTDLNGCQTTQNITLTEPTPLSQSISAFVYPSGTNISCFGASDGSVDLTINGGVGPYSYVWSNGATSQDLTNVTAGIYDVIVTDALGCQITSTITLNQPPSLSQSIVGFQYPSGTNISCFGASDGSIDLTIAGGNPGYTYLWNTGATTEDLTGVPAGSYTVVATDPNGCTVNSSITLVQPTALTIDLSAFSYIGGNNVSCTGASDGSIDLTVGGGSPIYTYNWSNGGTNQDINTLSAGTYSVTITDINGCQISGDITLTEPTILSYSATLTTVAGGFNVSACSNNGSIDVSVSGSTPNYSYVWNTGATSQDLNNLAGGTYSVIVTDANGCTISFDTTLTVSPVVTGVAQVTSDYNGQDISCFGASDGSVNATPLTGVPSYTYQWFNAANQPVGSSQAVNGLLAGTYSVIITDANGCTGTTNVTLVNPPALNSGAVVSTNYNGQDISCFGASDGGIDLSVNGGTPGYGYVWVNDQGVQVSTNQDPNGLPAGTYSVVVTDANGCITNTSISLTEPPVLVGVADVLSDYNGSDVSCFNYTDGLIGVESSGGTPGYVYQWFTSSGNPLGAGTNQPNVGQGNYFALVTDINGCTVIAPVVVTQPLELIMAPIITSNYFGNQVSCVGANDGAGYIYATGGTPVYTYNWGTSPVQTTQYVTSLGEGTFNVVVTDANGCTDNAQITLTANPLPTVNLPPPVYGCIGGEITLQSNPGPSTNCQWTLSNGDVYNDCGPINLTFENGACLDVQLVISTSLGCADTMSLTDYICVAPNPVASFTISDYELTSTDFDAFFYNNSQGANTYLWDFGDNTTSTVENPYHQYPQSGYENFTIWLYAYSDLGCVDSTVRYINFTEDMIIYVPNTFTPDYDEFNNTFYPVLSSGFNPQNYRLYIFNRWGELIFESRDHTVGWDGTYNGERCQIGTYIWKIVTMDAQNDRKREFVGHVNLVR